MKYNEQMLLMSKSGYCMPFEEQEGRDVKVTLHYGNQRHPQTGKKFFHNGIDFSANHYMLYAVADGIICGVGSEGERGMFQTIRYGKYEVTYRHLANVFANFGEQVKAGNVVSLSGDMMHMEVKFDGEQMNPIDFITMLYGNVRASEWRANSFGLSRAQPNMGAANVKAMEQRGDDMPQFETFEMTIPTNYDKDQKEIEKLMLRWLPSYMEALYKGTYVVPERTEQSLRNIFSLAGSKHYFFENIPTVSNPLGIGQRSMPLACKVQNLLIGDFLNYLALRQNIFLSPLTPDVKKK